MPAPVPDRWRQSWLARRVAESGRAWRYDEIVDALLYDPEAGFYGSGRGGAGRRGDFLTSPEVGPLFGVLLGRALDGWWDELGRPEPFVVAEAAAGPGTLARSVLAGQPRCARAGALDYVAVEVADAQRRLHPPSVRSQPALPERAHVVVANELLDDLPFRLAEWRDGTWREVLVDGDGEVPGAPLDDERLPTGAEAGARLPLQDRACAWVADARRRAHRVVVIDYGASTTALVRRPWTDWVRTYRQQQRGGHPLDDPGEQDVTCEVAFDQLPEPHLRLGQAEALRGWGIDGLVEEGRRLWADGAARGDLGALRGRSRVREAEALLDPSGLGAFQVVLWHGTPSDGA